MINFTICTLSFAAMMMLFEFRLYESTSNVQCLLDNVPNQSCININTLIISSEIMQLTLNVTGYSLINTYELKFP